MDKHDEVFADDEFLQDFIIETRENLETIQMNVLELETEADNKELIDSLFRSFHTIKGLAGFVDQELVEKVAHQTETILDFFRKEVITIDKNIADKILNSADLIGEICNDISLLKDKEFIEEVFAYLDQLAKLESEIADMNESQSNLPKEQITLTGDMTKGIKKAKTSNIQESRATQENDGGIIRIPTRKVDNLVDMMGELIITESQIEQEASQRFGDNDSFITKLLNMSRIMKEMQYLSMSLRMVSLKSTFNKIARIARDTIDELGKDVEFILEGEDTEIDRNIAERLLKPLVHLVKNSISHGIESSELRKERGKNVKGIVRVFAYSNKGSVYIEISDDGNGIDLEKVLKKAVEKRLIEERGSYSNKEIIDLIFLPGFSTTDVVNTTSGRGVGMDVVKTEVSRIGGKIDIVNTPGKGCKFILKIPINLAVMNGTIISIDKSKYIIPTLNIKQIVQLKEEQWVEVKGQKTMVKIRDSVIPLIDMGNILGEEIESNTGMIIILEMDKQLKALSVDNVEDRREIVVKPVGEEFCELDYISGASILGDGTVSLILDIEALFKLKRRKKGVG
ncbi:MAG: chemotaxis protein CheA [Halanaerobiales bacterium]